MFYNRAEPSFNRKIWQFFNTTYKRRVPENEREPISPEVIKRYLGISLSAYRQYIAEAAQAAGHSCDNYQLKWMIRIPSKQDVGQQHSETNYPEFYYLNHIIEPKQTYLATLSHNNPVLANRIERLIDRMVQASIVYRHKSTKTHAIRLENMLLWLLNEQFTQDNRIVIRVCMNKFNMPFTLWSHWGYYRNCSVSFRKLEKS